ncbi:MAG: hypothetical protein AB7N24_18925 [Dehalococcoidia bacterium]
MVLQVDFGGAEQLLREAEFMDCRSVWYSSNYVYIAQMAAGEQQFAAIYKPHKGESPLWDFADGHLYKHEAAAYEFSKLLGWDMVPPTVVRDGPQGIGSVQVFVPHDPEEHFFVQREREELLPQLMRMCAFDAVANNADRKGGHCLLDDRGHIWGIDHGLCFHPAPKLRSVIWEWAGDEVPAEFLDDLEEAGLEIAGESDAAAPLLALLHEHEAAAMLGRIERMLKEKTYPVPGQARHYPWPMV